MKKYILLIFIGILEESGELFWNSFRIQLSYALPTKFQPNKHERKCHLSFHFIFDIFQLSKFCQISRWYQNSSSVSFRIRIYGKTEVKAIKKWPRIFCPYVQAKYVETWMKYSSSKVVNCWGNKKSPQVHTMW